MSDFTTLTPKYVEIVRGFILGKKLIPKFSRSDLEFLLSRIGIPNDQAVPLIREKMGKKPLIIEVEDVARENNNEYLSDIDTDKLSSVIIKLLTKADKKFFSPIDDEREVSDISYDEVATLRILFRELIVRYSNTCL